MWYSGYAPLDFTYVARYRIAQLPCPERGACNFVYEVERFSHFYLGNIKLPIGCWGFVDRFETKDLAEAYIALIQHCFAYGKEYN